MSIIKRDIPAEYRVRRKQRRGNAMCELMEKFGEKKLEEGRLEGRTEGRIESARRTATALLALGKLTLSQIAEATELSQEEVKRLAGTLGA